MKTGAFWKLGAVSDQQRRSGLATLLASGYRTEARIIAHIAEVEERRLHLKDGCSSLFEHCVKRLGLSESEASYWLTAARLARRFPAVFAMVERREIHLGAVCLGTLCIASIANIASTSRTRCSARSRAATGFAAAT